MLLIRNLFNENYDLFGKSRSAVDLACSFKLAPENFLVDPEANHCWLSASRASLYRGNQKLINSPLSGLAHLLAFQNYEFIILLIFLIPSDHFNHSLVAHCCQFAVCHTAVCTLGLSGNSFEASKVGDFCKFGLAYSRLGHS